MRGRWEEPSLQPLQPPELCSVAGQGLAEADTAAQLQETLTRGQELEAETSLTRRGQKNGGLKNCLCGQHGGLTKALLLLFRCHNDSGGLSWGQTDVSFA